MIKTRFTILAMLCAIVFSAKGQDVAIKTNILDDALLNINVGIEVGVAPKWTVELPVSFNGWTLSHDRRWKHWAVQPEARYWLCDRFGGHFFGAHVHGGQFNIGGISNGLNLLGTDFSKLSDSRFQGWFVGAGVSYGYAWIINRHWNFEAELGLGYSYTRFDQFRCAGCGKKVATDQVHHYVGVTRLALNMVYLF